MKEDQEEKIMGLENANGTDFLLALRVNKASSSCVMKRLQDYLPKQYYLVVHIMSLQDDKKHNPSMGEAIGMEYIRI